MIETLNSSNSNSLETINSATGTEFSQIIQDKVIESVHSQIDSLQGISASTPISENSSSDGVSNMQSANTVDCLPFSEAQPEQGWSKPTYLVTMAPDIAVSEHANSGTSAVIEAVNKTLSCKRSLVNSSTVSPVVTKVIITNAAGKNSSLEQPQAIPVQIPNQLLALNSIGPGISVLPQAQNSQTPTKTITISSQSIAPAGKTLIAAMPGTPTKSGVHITKLPISPAKTPTKITMIPVSIAKSPQRAVLASSNATMIPRTISGTDRSMLTINSSMAGAGISKPTTITMSPSKLIIKQGTLPKSSTQQIQLPVSKPIQVATQQQAANIRHVTVSAQSVHQVQVPGDKLQYVRLVTPHTQAQTTTVSQAGTVGTSMVQTRPIVPATVTTRTPSQNNTLSQVKITLPIQGGTPVAPKPLASQGSTVTPTVQRIILPATSNLVATSATPSNSTSSGPSSTLTQIRPTLSATGSTGPALTQLPPGTTIFSTGNNVPGCTLVPTMYITQVQQQQSAKQQPIVNTQVRSEFIPIASNDPVVTANTLARNTLNGTTIEATGARPRKPCNCTKSQCLKLYCDCFANGEFCHNCNCTNCANNLEHEEERSRAIKACLDRNPMAFHPKIGKGKGKDGDGDRRHNKGCNCKRSGCLKNYCECYEAKIMCSSICKCVGCKNYEESPERKTLMHLADAAEVRVQQQTAAKSKLSSQISSLPSRPPIFAATGEKLPYTFVTNEVAEATCACLLAQADESDRLKMPPVVQERMIIEEFGRCLMQIIDSANKTKLKMDSDSGC